MWKAPMIGKVFRIFRERGGVLRALGLWEWYEALNPKDQKRVRYYFSLKSIRDMRFPFRAKHFESGEVNNPGYTRATLLGTLAQTALLEGKYEDAEWLYQSALEFAEDPYEKHLILNDLLMLYQKLRDFDRMERYALMDLQLFEDYRDKLRDRMGGSLPQLSSYELLVYILERKGEKGKALEILEKFHKEGIPHPFYEKVRERLKA
ncbi:MAG: hypothetical protein ABDH29_03555 [Aquificaceae bacterium]